MSLSSRKENAVSKSLVQSRPPSVKFNERLTLNEINNHDYENRLENQYSSRSNDYNSIKFHHSPESVKSNGLRKSEAKEVLKLKAELDLAKLNAESMKNELNVTKFLRNLILEDENPYNKPAQQKARKCK